MKKFSVVILIIIIIGIIGFFIYNFISNNNDNNKNAYTSYDAQRMSTQDQNSIDNNESNTEYKDKNSSDETLGNFSTKLPKDTKARYSNIELACETLNDTIIKSDETFSLWDTLRMPNKRKRV